MGFYATEPECERRGVAYPPSENRVRGFSATSRSRARRSASQLLEPHRENRLTPTATASGVLFYGYRYYNPELGRWVNRDPIEERGGVNLYGFVWNSAIHYIDLSGLLAVTFPVAVLPPGYLPPDEGIETDPFPMPGMPGPDGGTYYALPHWFLFPEDEGKPCCCEPKASLNTFKRTDRAVQYSWNINMAFEYDLSGCYKDVVYVWKTCIRPNGDSGYLPGCINSTSCSFYAGFSSYHGPYLTEVRIRYLSCENEKWVKHIKGRAQAYKWKQMAWRWW